MKQAFLIIAHNEYQILNLLIKLLDHKQSDIYILIDKKSQLPQNITVKYSNLFFLSNRVDIRWGDISQIKAELLLFQEAFNKGPYLYYHLLSGVDLPIKPIDYIISFFQENNGKEFVGYTNNNNWKERVYRYHFFTKYYRETKGIKALIIHKLRHYLENIINTLVKRKRNKIYYKGCNWCSITNNFCKYLLLTNKDILKEYKYTKCCDEIFIQTVLQYSPYKQNIYSMIDEYEGCMRLIDWDRGNPYVWGKDLNDFEIIKSSNKLFARKFNYKTISFLYNINENHTN